jgi:hypothetical protein
MWCLTSTSPLRQITRMDIQNHLTNNLNPLPTTKNFKRRSLTSTFREADLKSINKRSVSLSDTAAIALSLIPLF